MTEGTKTFFSLVVTPSTRRGPHLQAPVFYSLFEWLYDRMALALVTLRRFIRKLLGRSW